MDIQIITSFYTHLDLIAEILMSNKCGISGSRTLLKLLPCKLPMQFRIDLEDRMEHKTPELVYLGSVEPKRRQGIDTSNTKVVLRELYLLLEDYAPVWYTEEHHRRALKALLDREV
jgi:hypothetical protein